jgi:hypothetical protein
VFNLIWLLCHLLDLKNQLQRDPLTAVLSQIHGADVDLSGTDLKIKRTQTLGKKHLARRKRHVELALKLGGLERTLKVLEITYSIAIDLSHIDLNITHSV